LSQAVTEQLQAYSADFGALADRLSSNQEDKDRAADVLADMNARCRRIEEDLGRLKQDVSAASSGR